MTQYDRHNEETKIVWADYAAGKPTRVPVVIYYDARIWLSQEGQNPERVALADYIRHKDLMFECQVRAQEFKRLNILSDEQMGYPKEDGYSLMIDFQNYFEIVWLGGEAEFSEEPHARPFLTEENKQSILDSPPPGLFDGIGGTAVGYYEYFIEKARTYEREGIPVRKVELPFNMAGTDGPFTVACGIRGTENLISDLLFDTDYALRLLGYLTDAIIARIKAARRFLNQAEVDHGFGMGDDAIALVSPQMYQDFVLPFHKKIYAELGGKGGERGIHLCGNAQHLFPVLQKELGIKNFDTGFPIDFSRLYDELSPDTRVNGGPNVPLLKFGSLEEIRSETERILRSGVMEKSRKFVLRDGNSVCPGTKLENINQLYLTCKEAGRYC